MKKYSKAQRVLIILIILSLGLTVVLNGIKENSIYQSITGNTYTFFSSLRASLINKPVEAILDFTDSVTHFWQLQDENDQLRQELDAYQQNEAKWIEGSRKIAELEELLGLKTTYENYTLLYSAVTFRDVASWSNTVVIDVGTDDGLTAGTEYAVMTSKGVIGKTLSIGKTASTITLLTANDIMNQAFVTIQLGDDNVADAILKSYQSDTGEFILSVVGDSSSVAVGNTVVTSGKGGVYPSGLLVGNVSRVEASSDANSTNIYVDPSANFSSFDYVAIVVINHEE